MGNTVLGGRMEEKKIVYSIILSVWNLAKEYDFRKLSDDEWETLTEKAKIKREEFKQHGEKFDLLFRDMYRAIQRYYEGKNNDG